MKRTARPPRLDLNPSSADRWTTCTASPGFILANADKLPPDDGTKFSQEGTTAHEVAAAMLEGRPPRESECPTPIDAEMRMHAWDYSEYVTGLRKPFSRLLVEKKIPLWYMPGRNAIVDAAVLNPQDTHIIDYKYGEGVAVHPEELPQAIIYVVSVMKKLPPVGHEFPVSIHIFQPRGRNAADGPAHVWETTWGEIEDIAKDIEATASAILDEYVGNLPYKTLKFAPSEKACQWCPAKGFCEARRTALTQDIEALTVIADDAPSLPTANTITVTQLAAILKHKDQLVKWLDDAEEYALNRLKAGGKIDGFKLVMSRGGNRYWTDPKKAAKLLLEGILKRDEVIEEKVISPAAAEKLIGKLPVDLFNLVAKPPGYPTIAPEDDKREAIGSGAEDFTPLQ